MALMLKRLILLALTLAALLAAETKIVLIAGTPSHPPGMHEYNAGMLLLAKCLRQNGVNAIALKNGWPADESVLEGSAAIAIFSDGGAKHPALPHLDTLAKLMARGTGFAGIHYAVEVPVDRGGPEFLNWLGGYYETGYSKNPVNEVEVTQASPLHPISHGWTTYQLKDEWYYKIRFRPTDARVTPILTTMLPKDAPQRETLAWVTERADGGRSFGFTGAHFHVNWGKLESRRLVVNALLWIAKVPVPADGAKCEIADDDLALNLDDKPAPPPRKK